MDLDLNVEMPSAQAPAAQPPVSPSPSVQPTAKVKIMVPAVRRLDTMEKKRRLDAELGSNQADYWAAVLQFLSARISRYEFYEVVISTLGIENMRLHNDFFLAILYNANSTELPPSKKQSAACSLSPSMSPMEETPLVAVKASPSPLLTADLAPLTPTPSIPALAINSTALPSNSVPAKAAKPSKKKKPEPVLNPFTQRLAVSQFEQSQSQSNASLVDLPHIPMQHVGVPGMHRDYLKGIDSLASSDIVHVRDMLQKRAREAGIKAVSDDAVSALKFGLEQHLHKILTEAVKSAASDRARRQVLGELDDRRVGRKRSNCIGVQNLLSALVKNPGLVGDELPLIRERILPNYIV